MWCCSDPGTTGNFEIKVNGNLVHSKKTAGHGSVRCITRHQPESRCCSFLHSNPDQIQAVYKAIAQTDAKPVMEDPPVPQVGGFGITHFVLLAGLLFFIYRFLY